MNEIKRCQLCEERETGPKSHIISGFILRALANELGGARKLRTSAAPNRTQQDLIKLKFLCIQCEALFSKFETQFNNQIFSPYLKHGNLTLSIDDNAHKFLVSISWRVLRHAMHENPSLQEQGYYAFTEEHLRNYLLDKTKDAVGCDQFLLLDRDITTSFLKQANYTPGRLRYEISTHIARLKIQDNLFDALPGQPYVICKIGPMFILCRTYNFEQESSLPPDHPFASLLVSPNTTIKGPRPIHLKGARTVI